MKLVAWSFLGWIVFFTGNAQCDETNANVDHEVASSASKRVTGQQWSRMANQALGQGNKEKAIEYYSNAIASYISEGATSPIPFLYSNRASLKASLGSYQQAIEDYTKAIELKPDYSNAYRMRGNIYDKLDNRQQALVDYEKSDEIKKQLNDIAKQNKTPKEKKCDAKLIAYSMAISDGPADHDDDKIKKLRKQAMQIVAVNKNNKSCETVTELDQLFGQSAIK